MYTLWAITSRPNPRCCCLTFVLSTGFSNLAPVRGSRNIAVHIFPVTRKAGGMHGLKVAAGVVFKQGLHTDFRFAFDLSFLAV